MRELVELEPMDNEGYCHFCGGMYVYIVGDWPRIKAEIDHRKSCLWVRAKKLLE